jgi:hypothetical protein
MMKDIIEIIAKVRSTKKFDQVVDVLTELEMYLIVNLLFLSLFKMR